METLGLRGLLFLAIFWIQLGNGISQLCQVTVTQESYKEVKASWGSVTLSCQITATNCAPYKLYWFRYLESRHEVLCAEDCKDRFTSTKTDKKAQLEVRGLQRNDSGVYICGIIYPDSLATGSGTTLVVRDKPATITAECIALIVLCVLLFAYCITVYVVYAYRSKWKPCYFATKRKTKPNEGNKSFPSRRIFQAIAQEYNKRYPRKTDTQNKARDDDTIYQNT